MDHDEVIEQLELAAVEPDGLERLMAGDTTMAAAVAGHLAGCPRCADELERLRRAVPLVRDVVRTTPPADLRERTLAHIREHGRQPVAEAPRPVAVVPGGPPVAVTAGADRVMPTPGIGRPRGVGDVLPWVAAIAAAIVISVAASSWYLGAQLDDRFAEQDRAIAGLEAVTSATLALTAETDARRVALAAEDGSDASGTLIFSPRTTELVVVADGLPQPPDGEEYRCWLSVDGERRSVGRMYFANDLAYWVGDTPDVGSVTPGTVFGVSLVEIDGTDLAPDPVISGRL